METESPAPTTTDSSKPMEEEEEKSEAGKTEPVAGSGETAQPPPEPMEQEVFSTSDGFHCGRFIGEMEGQV